MSRQVVSISLTEELATDLSEFAKEEHRSKSDVARDALQSYIQLRRWRSMQKETIERAQALGIGPDDVERLVDEVRAEMKAESEAA